jgi:hypothetical protein
MMNNLLVMPPQYTDAQARRWARKADYRAVKARGKQHINNRGGYQLVDDCNNVVAGVNFDLTATEVVEFCKRELHDEAMTDDGSDVSIQPVVSPEEWAELITDVAVNLMESEQ